jgi:hypothetical protein
MSSSKPEKPRPTETRIGGTTTALSMLLSWLAPGLGHWWLGERARGLIFFVVIGVTFWAGVAVGGVRSTVSPRENGAWIAAQLCAGPQALAALVLHYRAASQPDEQYLRAPWPASNISVVYAGVAGLLNLLIIIDAMSRAETRGRVTASRGPPARKGG